MAYLDLAGFQGPGGTIMPTVLVSRLEAERPGWIAARLEKRSRYIDAKLVKRYAVPFDEADPPLVVIDWLVAIVTLEAYGALGVSVTSDMDQALIVAPYTEALKQIDEAANSETGLFELPLQQGAAGSPLASGLSQGSATGSADASPYEWMDRQACAVSEEDGDVG